MEKNENINEIKNIYIQIEIWKLTINKKEDDLKNIINEKDIIIQDLQEKLMNQEKKIVNNEKEISKLNEKIETNKKEIEKLTDKIGNKEKELAKLNNKIEGNEKEIKKLNSKNEEFIKNTENLIKEDDIKRAKMAKKLSQQQEIISEGITNISRRFGGKARERITEELKQLVDLERNYGFLSSIGVKLLRNNDNDTNYQIEGLIKAPENSPYKNGIFNFLLKYGNDYPNNAPELLFKTKILHCECNENGHCCTQFLNDWNQGKNLSQIIGAIYQFFMACHFHHCGYANEAKRILETKDVSFFDQKCQEYVRSYANLFFDDNSDYYLFQDINDETSKELFSKDINCVFLGGDRFKLFFSSFPSLIELKQILSKRVNNNSLDNKAIIIGNKVYSFINPLLKIFSNSKTIFISPKALSYY